MAASTNLPDLRTEYPPHPIGRDPAERSTLLGLLPGIAGALRAVTKRTQNFTKKALVESLGMRQPVTLIKQFD